MWTLSLITPPLAEPLDLETEVYPHLRLEPDLVPQETLLRVQVAAARQRCETFTSRQLITATWELWLDSWTASQWCGAGAGGPLINLPRAPLQAQAGPPEAPTAGVLSVRYLDTAGTEQTLDPSQYVVTAPQGPTCARGSIHSPYAVIWPTVRQGPAAVRIRFTAGYGPLWKDVPGELRQGMLLTIGELDGTREEQTVGTIVAPNILRAEHLWYPFRLW